MKDLVLKGLRITECHWLFPGAIPLIIFIWTLPNL